MLKIVLTNINYENPISILTIPIFAILLSYFIFKIKRFSNGFNFLKNTNINKDLVEVAIFFCGIIIFIFGLFQRTNNTMLNTLLLSGTILIAISFQFWIRNQITKHYRKNMRERTIEIQKTEIDEQLKIIHEIEEENYKLARTIHKYNNKLSALENGIKNTLKLKENVEFSNELTLMLNEVQNTSKEFVNETIVNKKIPLTNVKGIDNMFQYMKEEANKNNIHFDLRINSSIDNILDKVINKEKLEILIGDHLRDSIIAINSSDCIYKNILVELGIVNNYYELSIYDTGIEFEVETLLKLGLEPITTHKNEGGSGIGFMTTFETLRECKASLIIEEYNPETTNYTKSLIVRFDNKNNYIIRSYRAEKIRSKSIDNRVIIENL